MPNIDRVQLNFENEAKRSFSFLIDLEFSLVESLSTLVRYEKGDVEVSIYHGRLSYEIGAEIEFQKKQYNLVEIVRFFDPEIAANCCHTLASTKKGVSAGLAQLGSLMKRYAVLALEGDPIFFSNLNEKREIWIEKYWIDALARKVRPEADDAFRRKDYAKAAELYARILPCLSQADIKKLRISEARGKR